MYPQLRSDSSSIDFIRASYENRTKMANGYAEVTNILREAPELDGLIESSKAKWIIEIRAPRALWSKSYTTDNSTFEISWKQSEVGSEVFVLSGLVATVDLTIPVLCLSPAWSEVEDVYIPKGAWLARGSVAREKSTSASILEFINQNGNNNTEKFPPGRMEIDGPTSDFKFLIKVAEDVFHNRNNRIVQNAALIGAMSRIPRAAQDYDEYSEPIPLREIRQILEKAEVPIWESDDFDAATAATLLEEFRFSYREESNEED